jgi:hypothetical protein
MKKIRNLVALIGLLFFGFFATFHVWPDEARLPQAQQWMQTPAPTVAEIENVYFTMLGFGVPLEQDAHEAGVTWARQMVDIVHNYRSSGKEVKILPVLEQASTADMRPLDDVCAWETEDCFNVLAENLGTEQMRLGEWQGWLNRYRSMYLRPRFEEIMPQELFVPTPPFAQIMKVQRLLHTELGILYHHQQFIEAQTKLAQDLDYSRMLLRDARTILSKMVAVRMYAQVLHVYSAFLDVTTVPPEVLQVVLEAITAIAPLNAAELSLQQTLRSEFEMVAWMYALYPNSHDLSAVDENSIYTWITPFLPFKRNATINRVYHTYHNNVLHSESEHGADYSASQPMPTVWEWLYNPIGTTLNQIATPDFSRYSMRLHELNGLIALLKLKAYIRANNIPASELKQAPYQTHPHSGKPLHWDSDKRVLRYAESRTDSAPIYTELRMGAWFHE